MNIKQKIFLGILSIILILISIYQAIFLKEAHFYSLFSLGMTLLLGLIYYSYFNKPLFKNWKSKHFIYFIVLLIFICIIIDQLGLVLGYWNYPQYYGFYDELIKIIFEFALPFIYITLTLIIGIEIFNKIKINYYLSIILSLIIFVTLIGLVTETVNNFVHSWNIITMPITNRMIGNYYLMFITIGYWLMAIITYFIYKFIDSLKK